MSEVVEIVERVRAVPYGWPSPPTADAARQAGWGSCASKHALLAEELAGAGVDSRPVFAIGPLVPDLLAHDPAISAGTGLLEVHEYLTVSVPGVGPCRVDVTWDPPLVAAGLPGVLDWDGASDMPIAVGESSEVWAPDPTRLREEKEALRARLYRGDQRAVRDGVLASMSGRFAHWRASPT